MKNFQQIGDTVTLTAPSGGVVSGGIYKIGQLIVVASFTADEGDTFEAAVNGVFAGVPKTTGQAWAEGALVYWNDGGTLFTTSSSGNVLAGCAVVSAQSADTLGTVRLNGIAAATS